MAAEGLWKQSDVARTLYCEAPVKLRFLTLTEAGPAIRFEGWRVGRGGVRGGKVEIQISSAGIFQVTFAVTS